MEHLGAFRTCQAEFNHQLATVADTQRECVGTGVETVEGLLGLGVEEESTGPALGRTEYVAVGEASAEDNHLNLVEGLAARDEVGHHHVLHVETGQVEAPSHLALTISAFLANDGGLGLVKGEG